MDASARLLRAAVGFALVPPDHPELRLLHLWLDYNAPPIIRAIELEPTFGGVSWRKIVGAFSRDPASWPLAHSQ